MVSILLVLDLMPSSPMMFKEFERRLVIIAFFSILGDYFCFVTLE